MAYVYRAYYAIPTMTTQHGLHTNAVFGFVRMLEHMLAAAAPDYIAVCFDTREPTFRHAQFADYKAQRPPMPEPLVEQLPWIKEYLRTLNIVTLEYPGYEADDVIATLACHARDNDMMALIASSDKDLCQLVQPRIAILKASLQDAEVWDEAAVVAKYGVRPDQIVDYLTLVGDASDNIPGVPGIGPKTAQMLLQTYQTLDAICDRIDELKPAVQVKLRGAMTRLAQVRDLIRVHCSVPVKEGIDELALREPDVERLTALRAQLNFRTPAAATPRTSSGQRQPDLFAAS
jgi:DNA polymerase-1